MHDEGVVPFLVKAVFFQISDSHDTHTQPGPRQGPAAVLEPRVDKAKDGPNHVLQLTYPGWARANQISCVVYGR